MLAICSRSGPTSVRSLKDNIIPQQGSYNILKVYLLQNHEVPQRPHAMPQQVPYMLSAGATLNIHNNDRTEWIVSNIVSTYCIAPKLATCVTSGPSESSRSRVCIADNPNHRPEDERLQNSRGILHIAYEVDGTISRAIESKVLNSFRQNAQKVPIPPRLTKDLSDSSLKVGPPRPPMPSSPTTLSPRILSQGAHRRPTHPLNVPGMQHCIIRLPSYPHQILKAVQHLRPDSCPI